MSITTILAMLVAVRLWRWSSLLVAALFGPLLAVDLAFFATTLLKVPDGGWFPLVIAMSANAMSATAFFDIPPGRVVEFDTRIEI